MLLTLAYPTVGMCVPFPLRVSENAKKRDTSTASFGMYTFRDNPELLGHPSGASIPGQLVASLGNLRRQICCEHVGKNLSALYPVAVRSGLGLRTSPGVAVNKRSAYANSDARRAYMRAYIARRRSAWPNLAGGKGR